MENNSKHISNLLTTVTENDLFIMRNDSIEDPHVSAAELKTKLNQFKQQLQLVKSIYNNNYEQGQLKNKEVDCLMTKQCNNGSTPYKSNIEDCRQSFDTYSQTYQSENDENDDNVLEEMVTTYHNCNGESHDLRNPNSSNNQCSDCRVKNQSVKTKTDTVIQKQHEATPKTSSSIPVPKLSISRIPRKAFMSSPRKNAGRMDGETASPKHVEKLQARPPPSHRRTHSSVTPHKSSPGHDILSSGTDLYSSDPECDGIGKTFRRKYQHPKKNSTNNSKSYDILRKEYQEKFEEFQKQLEEKSSAKELSLNSQLQYFSNMSSHLQHRCQEFEKEFLSLQEQKIVVNEKAIILKEDNLKLSFEKSQLFIEYEKLKKEKLEIEGELIKSHKMLNESFRFRKATEDCLQALQSKKNNMLNELKESQNLNENLRTEVATLTSMCSRNDDRLKCAQEVEQKLQECLKKANQQISELEQQSREKEINNHFEFKKLLDEHEKLQKEHETVKILYAESIQKIRESMKEIDDVKRCQSSKFAAKQKQQNTMKIYTRKTWFTHHPLEQQFVQPDSDALSDTESDRGPLSKIPQRSNSVQDNDEVRSNYSRNSISYTSNESIGTSRNYGDTSPVDEMITSPLLRSLSTEDYANNNYIRSNTSSPKSEVSFKNAAINYSRSQSIEDYSFKDVSSDDGSSRKAFELDTEYSVNSNQQLASIPFKRTNSKSMPQGETSRNVKSWYVPVHSGTSEQKKQVTTKIPSRLKSYVKKNHLDNKTTVKTACHSVATTTSRRESLERNSLINDPTSNVICPRVTTDEVLETVKQQVLDVNKPTAKPMISRLAQFSNKYGREEAEDRMQLEEKLNQLNAEKTKLDTQLGRIPTRSSGRMTRQFADQERKLEDRYDIVMKELATVRMSLRNYKLL